MSSSPDSNNNSARRFLKFIWAKPKSRWQFGIPVGGFILLFGGLIFMFTFELGLEYTNTEAFCADSCHSMNAYIKPEWAESVHYKNRTGVRAICSYCHVPKAFFPKMVAKVVAVKDLYHEIIGSMNTREDFDASRLKMARRVWKKMRETDSRECRNCHTIDHMAFDKQLSFQHKEVTEMGRTCIDCHKGIAHNLPETEETAEMKN